LGCPRFPTAGCIVTGLISPRQELFGTLHDIKRLRNRKWPKLSKQTTRLRREYRAKWSGTRGYWVLSKALSYSRNPSQRRSCRRVDRDPLTGLAGAPTSVNRWVSFTLWIAPGCYGDARNRCCRNRAQEIRQFDF
jgi:hypothetical protein